MKPDLRLPHQARSGLNNIHTRVAKTFTELFRPVRPAGICRLELALIGAGQLDIRRDSERYAVRWPAAALM
jgi:hypothetical protein